MKEIRIDFNQSEPCIDGRELGETGEKNVAQLVITPPAEMSENGKITNYVVAFSTAWGPLRLDAVAKTEQIIIPLTEELTAVYPIALQLEGHDDEDEYIMKTPVLKDFSLGESIPEGNSCPHRKKHAGHFHSNFNVLQKLSEEDGMLMYSGKSIEGQKTKTVELLESNGDVVAYTDHSVFGSVHFVVSSGIPENVEILSVEIKVEDSRVPDEWVDLRNMRDTTVGYSPFIVNFHKSFYIEEYGGVCVAVVYFLNETVNAYYEAVSNGTFRGIRVTYVESGAE